MGNAARCSHLRALQSTGISCFTKSQVKLYAQSSCLVILALIREAECKAVVRRTAFPCILARFL